MQNAGMTCIEVLTFAESVTPLIDLRRIIAAMLFRPISSLVDISACSIGSALTVIDDAPLRLGWCKVSAA